MKEEKKIHATDQGALRVPMSRRSLLKGTATIAGGSLAASLLGASAFATQLQPNDTSAATVATDGVKYVTEDNYWLGGF